jgi:hypothetical protein
MRKILRFLASISAVIERISEIQEGVQVLERDIAEVKCEIARQGEELDLLYTQHCQATSTLHNRRAGDLAA